MTLLRHLLLMVALAVGLVVIVWILETVGIGAAVLVLLLWVLPVMVGYRLHVSKERDSPIVLALLLGWLGVLVAVALPAAGRRCPFCDESVRSAAVRCRHCGADLRLQPRT